MQQVDGIWLPDGDTHFREMMRKEPSRDYRGRKVGVYQFGKINRALALTTRKRVALDVGAHVGFWSMWLALQFDRVCAFEPVPEHVECWKKNLGGAVNAGVWQFALGKNEGSVGISVDPDNTGKSCVKDRGDVQMVTLDSLNFDHVDLLKIDAEGFESAVIEGAAQTIRKCNPVIVVESNGQHERYGLAEPVRLLQGLGAVILERMRHDVILGWPDAV